MLNIRIGSEFSTWTAYSPFSHAISRQTVFYTPSTLTISEGEQITGTLTCAPNARNNRDLDITIAWTAPDGVETKFDYKMCEILPLFLYTCYQISDENADRWSGLDASNYIGAFIVISIHGDQKLFYID